MASKHLFHLKGLEPQVRRSGGTRTQVTSKEFPILDKISIAILEIEKLSVREPHWHPNAHEMLYCLKGKAWVTILTDQDRHEQMTVQPGEAVFIPMGYLHCIENIGEEKCQFLVVFSHENPEVLHLSSAFGAMSPHVIAATLSGKESSFKVLPAIDPALFFTQVEKHFTPPNPQLNNRYKYDLVSNPPELKNIGGWVRKCQKNLFSELKSLALYDLMLASEGIREPHWHPNANELNYVISGHVKLRILSPDGSLDQFEMKAGDVSFIPRSYYHHIETVGEEPAHLAVFFSHEQPSDIGLSGSVGAMSNEVLNSIFHNTGPDFKEVPKYQEDRIVVKG